MFSTRFLKPAARVAAVLALAAQIPAGAQDTWPSKTITYVVPYPPGGTTDIVGRLIAQRLGTILSGTVIVDNKPGATGAIGSTYVARSAPDGYTILGTSIGPQAIVPNLVPKLTYDPVRSFQPVALIGTVPHVAVVAGSSSYRSLGDLIADARKRPGQLVFASGGNGTILQMQGELLKTQAKIDMLHVPYKGDIPALQDVLAGHATMMFAPIAAALPHIQSGKLRALAVTSKQRLKPLPAVPTMAEAGVPDFVAEQWQAVYLPAGAPEAITRRLSTEVKRILAEPEVAARLEGLGITPVAGGPQELAETQRADTLKWGRVIKDAGIKAE